MAEAKQSFFIGTKNSISEEDFVQMARALGVMKHHSVSDHNSLIMSLGYCPLCNQGSQYVPDILLEKAREESS